MKSPPYGLLASFPLHSSCLTTRSTRDRREGSDVRSDPTGGRRVGDGDVRRIPNERSLQGRAVSQTVPNVSECAAPLKKPIGSTTGCSCMGQKKGLNRAKTWRRIWQHNIGVESSPTSEPGSHFRCSQPLHDCVCIARHGWGHLYLKNGTSNLHLLCRFSGFFRLPSPQHHRPSRYCSQTSGSCPRRVLLFKFPTIGNKTAQLLKRCGLM